MRGVYTVRVNIASLTTAKTVLLGTLPSGMLLEILEAKLTQGDQEIHEQMKVGLYKVTTLGSITGTSISASNVQKTDPGSNDTSVTWTSNLTVEPTAYNANPIDVEGVPNEVGYKYDPKPEGAQLIGSGASFGLRLLASLTNAIDAEIVIRYREIGG